MLMSYVIKPPATMGVCNVVLLAMGPPLLREQTSPVRHALGFKVVDEDAIDLSTNEPEFYDNAVDDNGNVTRVYQNAQSAKTCVPLAVCLSKETDELLKSEEGFMSIFRWCQECSQ
jgi:hypothetical protein